MTNRRNNKGNKPRKIKSTRKATPFADTGRALGSVATHFTGIPGLKNIGSLFGAQIGRIFGSGDYQIAGPQPKVNALMGTPPQFSSTRATNIVCHREYITDITGTTAFTNRVFPLNPGDTQTFPWLSTIAANYSQYRFHGVVFEFKPLITDFVVGGAPGVVVMSTNYNADDPLFTNKRAMENSEFAVSIKPTDPIMHMIECDPQQTSINELYVRVGNNPGGVDKKTTDLANFQFATVGNPVQLLGELWVTYCVEFFKPELPNSGLSFGSHVTRTTAASATIDFGVTSTGSLGSISNTSGQTAINYFGLSPLTKYVFNYRVVSTAGVINALPTFTVGPGTAVPGYTNAAGTPNIQTNTTVGVGGNSTFIDIIMLSDVTGALVVNIVAGSFTVPNQFGVDIYLLSMEQILN